MAGDDKKYRFQPPSDIVEAYFWDRSPLSAIRGPLGSGKTQATIMKFMQLMTEQPPNDKGVRPTRLAVIRNTYPDLITTTIKDWSAITAPIAKVKMGHPPEQMLRYMLADGTQVECNVVFVALDREEHVRKLRGFQATWAWLNEMKELPFGVVEMIDARLGRYPSVALAGVDCNHPGMIVGDTNAPDEDHWYAKMEQDPPKNWSFYVQPGAVLKAGDIWVPRWDADNVENLPKGYYEKLLAGKREDWIRVNLANEFGTAIDGKPIWPEFEQTMHVREFDVVEDAPIITGMDFGLTPAMVLAQEIDGQLRVFDEIVTDNFSAEELAEAAKQRKATEWPFLRWGHGWSDPSNPRSQSNKDTPLMMMQRHGFNIIKSPSNDFTLRRDAVASRLTRVVGLEPAILIHPRCKILKKGMAGHYMYKRLKVAGDEAYHDVPNKNMFSHVCEALQYLCLGMGDGDLLTYGSDMDDWGTPINKPIRRAEHARRRIH